MKLIVGLGNPGTEYIRTRHNVGFMVVEELASQLGAPWCDSSKWQAETAEAAIRGQKVVLLKPQTYMNLSGEAVGKFAQYYQLESTAIWVVSDDIDLPLGKIRIREEGSSGGHNGLKSISSSLGSEAYYRIRIGVGPRLEPTNQADQLPDLDAAIYVLQAFDAKEKPLVSRVISQAAQLILSGLTADQLESHTITIDYH